MTGIVTTKTNIIDFVYTQESKVYLLPAPLVKRSVLSELNSVRILR